VRELGGEPLFGPDRHRDTVQQVIECLAELGELVGGRAEAEAVGEVVFAPVGGTCGHLGDRASTWEVTLRAMMTVSPMTGRPMPMVAARAHISARSYGVAAWLTTTTPRWPWDVVKGTWPLPV
jgi:hypothetical protein